LKVTNLNPDTNHKFSQTPLRTSKISKVKTSTSGIAPVSMLRAYSR